MVWRFLKKTKQTKQNKTKTKLGIEPPFAPAVPFLGIYPEETKIERDIYIPLFIAALCTIARTWKQPRCPSTEEWIKKMRYVYTMEYYSAIQRNEIVPFAETQQT